MYQIKEIAIVMQCDFTHNFLPHLRLNNKVNQFKNDFGMFQNKSKSAINASM